MMQGLAAAFRRTPDYSGRSGRVEYWSYAAFACVCLVVAVTIANIVDPHPASTDRAAFIGPILLLLGFALCVPGLAVSVRRLHDSGLDGWWAALPVAPILFWVVAIVGGFNAGWLFRIVMVAIVLPPTALLVLMTRRGTIGPNRFGPDPKSLDV